MTSNFFKNFFKSQKDEQPEIKAVYINETDYTQKLGSAIDNYIKNERVYIPHTTKQAQRNFKYDSYSFDLIKRISNSSFLILEIKITKDLVKFDSYNNKQHEFNIILRNAGIPIDYCYNTKLDYHFNNDLYALDNSNTSKPNNVCDKSGYLSNIDKHQSLKQLLDILTSEDNENNSDTISALFSEGVTSTIRQFNLRFLFIAYDSSLRKAITLESKDIIRIYNSISKYIEKESLDLDFKSATNQELINYFKTNSIAIKDARKKFETYKKKEIEKEIERDKVIQKNRTRKKYRDNSKENGMSM